MPSGNGKNGVKRPAADTAARRSWTGHDQSQIDKTNMLRGAIIGILGRDHPGFVVGALFYEVVSVIAAGCATEQEAMDAVRSLLEGAEEQIRQFGVGELHP